MHLAIYHIRYWHIPMNVMTIWSSIPVLQLVGMSSHHPLLLGDSSCSFFLLSWTAGFVWSCIGTLSMGADMHVRGVAMVMSAQETM